LELTKALVVRNHDLVHAYVDRLFALFGDESLGWDAAKAIGEIGSGGEGVLTKKNFAVLRVRASLSFVKAHVLILSLKILSGQKFFNTVLPRIVAGVKSTEGRLHLLRIQALTHCLIGSRLGPADALPRRLSIAYQVHTEDYVFPRDA